MRHALSAAVLIAAAAPPVAAAPPASLEIRNITAAYGRLGPPRPDLRLLPYDQVFFRFELAGVKTDAEGQADISTAVSITDPKGKTTGGEPLAAKVPLVLGGGRLAGFATAFLTPEQKPGLYTIRVRVKDALSGKEAEFVRQLELLDERFGAASLNFSADPEGNVPAPAGGAAGSAVFVRYLIVGFAKKGKVDVEVETRILDEAGKDTLPKPMKSRLFSDKPAEFRDVRTLTVVNSVLLHRPGRFLLEITLTDKVGDSQAFVRLPLTVASPDDK
jgi:hypothetical protein